MFKVLSLCLLALTLTTYQYALAQESTEGVVVTEASVTSVTIETISPLQDNEQMRVSLVAFYEATLDNAKREDIEVSIGEPSKIKIIVLQDKIQTQLYWPFIATLLGKELPCPGPTLDFPSGKVCEVYQEITTSLATDLTESEDSTE
jgi:hypothetical protein